MANLAFSYNSVTIGGSSDYSGVLGKPVYGGDRQNQTITFRFWMRAATEAAFWTLYKTYLTDLIVPEKDLTITFEGGTTLKFENSPGTGYPLGVPISVDLQQTGEELDIDVCKTFTITFHIYMAGVVVNGAKNSSVNVMCSHLGKKVATITCEVPTRGAGAMSSFTTNYLTYATYVLSVFGGIDQYILTSKRFDTTDPRMGDTPTNNKLVYATFTATYEQVIYNQEVGARVSSSLIGPSIVITSEAHLGHKLFTADQVEDADLRYRIRVQYQTAVRMDGIEVQGTLRDLSWTVTTPTGLSESYLAEVFEKLCLPRIEEVVAGQRLGSFSLLDAQIVYNPDNGNISANLLYDTDLTLSLWYKESVTVETKVGTPHKILSGENNDVFVRKPGAMTFTTIITEQEYFNDVGPMSLGSNSAQGSLLGSSVAKTAGQPRIRRLYNGYPVYETTSVIVSTASYVTVSNGDQSPLEDQSSAYFGGYYGEDLFGSNSTLVIN